MGRNVRRLVRDGAALVVAACGRPCDTGVVALVAHDARVRTLRADRVQERQENALLHEFVDLGNSLVQRRWVRWHVRIRQSQEPVTDFGREIDL